ncbi:hypothetical protein TRFO_05718 [Tritrichomonas foetus]|uniref:Uncharacterized protein n=1 Tax=Tritrichomonas foetus TaxID=1144522 RepID=A0A1J4K8R1_9EUKA|nr:hypothetical protein TRFO_05718 [Tritrichomonas foetus]|eukprot:OHT06062.1 hypothetical protein TRFO_05718 [Tritrichomonas foetus]
MLSFKYLNKNRLGNNKRSHMNSISQEKFFKHSIHNDLVNTILVNHETESPIFNKKTYPKKNINEFHNLVSSLLNSEQHLASNIINEMHNFIMDPTLQISKESIDEDLFDYFLNALLLNDKEIISAIIPLFQTLITCVPSIADILIQEVFIDNLFSIAEDKNAEINDLSNSLIIDIFLTNADTLAKSMICFDRLIELFKDVENNDLIKKFLIYIDRIICYQPDFVSYHLLIISQFLSYILGREDYSIFYTRILSTIFSLIKRCFNSFSPFIIQFNFLSSIITNLIQSYETNISIKTTTFQILVNLVKNTFDFSPETLGQVCILVSSNWHSTIGSLSKSSWELTYFLLLNYQDSITIFVSNDIFSAAFLIFYDNIDNRSYDYDTKIFAIFSFLNIAIRSSEYFQSNESEIYDVYNDLKDNNHTQKNQQILDILESKFQNTEYQ